MAGAFSGGDASPLRAGARPTRRIISPARPRYAIAREQRLKEQLAKLGDRYQIVLIDCPPSLHLLTLNALAAADSVLIPVQCESMALEGLTDLLDTVKAVRKRLNPQLEVEGLLRTMCDVRTALGNDV